MKTLELTPDQWETIYRPITNLATGNQEFQWLDVVATQEEFVWLVDENGEHTGYNNGVIVSSLHHDFEANYYMVTALPMQPDLDVFAVWPYWEEHPETGVFLPIYTDIDTYEVAYALGHRDAINEKGE